ncbi:MAG TPA: cytochrome c [Panacibacter sp.]|nr:cytochrome c [Panacibacter sp.]HNP45688.1 cytochrome c [Panacibacter sp.]
MKKTISVLVVSTFCYIVFAQTVSKDQMQRGKTVFETYCLTCHQEDGTGVPKLNPPLIKTSYVTGDKRKIITWVLSGTTEKIEIDGEYYSNNMPPQNYLKDQEIADVLTYIRNSFGNKSSAISATDVKNVRATMK